MSWMGKILGGGLGFMFGGPIGAVLGAVAGHHAFDNTAEYAILSPLESKQSIYFVAIFSMLSKLTKADGTVTQLEIEVIDRVMRENLHLSSSARDFAIETFNR